MKKEIRRFKLDKNFDFNIIKDLSIDELNALSDDIRELIIDRCSTYGGHLSSNLGIIKLTVGLFRSFDFNKDKIIFDIGHYSYPYKILTGRPLTKLRQEDGCDGFQKRSESKYDIYDAGHSSTSISAAIGFAKARDLNHENHHCLAVVGDGAIANGLCFEALNNLIVDNTKIIVVLNDNEMSISPTIGGLSIILKGIKRNPFASIIFKDANFEYIGPVDGDNFKQMKVAFERAKKTTRSVILHVKTKKGEGLKYAMEDQKGEFHFVHPFNKETGKPIALPDPTKKSFSKIISDLVDEEMSNNQKVISICPSTTVGACLTDVFKKYPDRTYDCGISEEHSAIFANALAINDFKIYLFMYSTFLQRAYDEIIHDIARMNSDVTFLIDRGGLIGADGETHQGIYDVSFFYSIPNVTLSMPHDETDAKNLFNLSKTYHHPFGIRYTPIYFEKEDDYVSNKNLNFGEWDYVLNKSSEVAFLTFGPHLNDIYRALKDDDIALINTIFIKNYNEEEIVRLLKFKKIFIYDPYTVETGFGANLVNDLIKHGYKGEIKTRCVPLSFISKGTIESQEKRLNLDPSSVIKEFKEFIR